MNDERTTGPVPDDESFGCALCGWKIYRGPRKHAISNAREYRHEGFRITVTASVGTADDYRGAYTISEHLHAENGIADVVAIETAEYVKLQAIVQCAVRVVDISLVPVKYPSTEYDEACMRSVAAIRALAASLDGCALAATARANPRATLAASESMLKGSERDETAQDASEVKGTD